MLALVGAWLWRAEPSRESVGDAQAASAKEAHSPPEPLAPAGATMSEPGPFARGAREDALDRTCAPVRGQLVVRGSGEPLSRRCKLLLASEGNRVAESVTSGESGSFTSTLAFPPGELRAWIRDFSSGRSLGQNAEFFDPGAEAPWIVPVEPAMLARASPELDEYDPEPEFQITGRVTDRGGREVENAHIRASGPGSFGDYGWSESDGRFTLTVEGPGEYTLSVELGFAQLRESGLHLRDVLDVGDLVLPLDDASCGLSGSAPSYGSLLLEESSSRRRLDVPVGNGRRFEVSGLRPGAHRLTFFPTNRRLELATLEVDAPASGLEFAPSTRHRSYGFEVLDATTGERVERGRVHAELGGHWGEYQFQRVPFGFERWVVEAEGYSPKAGEFKGSFSDSAEEQTDVIVVRLQPGQGTVHRAYDAEAWDEHLYQPLSGVRARRGSLLGPPSGADGLVWEELDSALRLEFELPGWRLREGWSGSGDRLLFERL